MNYFLKGLIRFAGLTFLSMYLALGWALWDGGIAESAIDSWLFMAVFFCLFSLLIYKALTWSSINKYGLIAQLCLIGAVVKVSPFLLIAIILFIFAILVELFQDEYDKLEKKFMNKLIKFKRKYGKKNN